MKFLVSTQLAQDELRIVDPHVRHVYTGKKYFMFEVYVEPVYRDTRNAFHIAARKVMSGVYGLDFTKNFIVVADSGKIVTFATPDGYDLIEVEND